MAEWKSICHIDDIPRLGSRVVRPKNGGSGESGESADRGEGGDIALFRTSSDEVFALRDRCPHKGGPLSQGMVHGNQVTCPLHGWKLRLDSGEAVAPDQGCARRYPVRIESGTVFLEI
jgi:nitrite reductase (NADH) small subunit